MHELRAAFARAGELRDKLYEEFRLRNSKGKVTHPLVIRTNFQKHENGSDYFQVLIPYSEIEQRNARARFLPKDEGQESLPPHRRKGLHIPVHFHTQWVREDRLERVK